jgi:ribosome-associated protein
MLIINETLFIPLEEFTWTYARSGGPGGQNVNKVASKALLRWDLKANTSLPEGVMARLRVQQQGRITNEGELLITSERYRDQERNRQDCLEKLRALVLQAAVIPRPRKKTRPSRASRERRLANKRHRSSIKAFRRKPVPE